MALSRVLVCQSFTKYLNISTRFNLPFNNCVRCLATRYKRDKEDPPYFESENAKTDPTVITVPTRLSKRLSKKVEKESKTWFQRQRLLKDSRSGSKSTVVISSRRPELNYYKGQSYGRKEQISLISTGWKHRKSHGDHFTIHPISDSDATISVEGRESFESLGISPIVTKVLKEDQIEAPTVIQATAIPEILKGRNNLLAAETGCGKTLAYLLPVFEQILARRRINQTPNQPLALVLLPTRELAEQVFTVANSLGYPLGIRARVLQGGNVQSKMKNPSTKEVDVLVATINIISTLSIMDVYDMSRVKHVVLDEADTLLDDSFSDDVLRFLKRFPFEGENPIQATLVSATMPRSVETILGEVIPMDSLRRITTPGLHRIVKTVPQTFRRVRKMDKPQIVLDIVEKQPENPTIIFANKTETCHWLWKHFSMNDVNCIAIHGKMRPSERRGLLEQYQSGEVNVMICTDLGSRGIDTVRTKHVVNYEFPRFIADYVHRIGRVGRVGSASGGCVTNLISGANEIEIVQQIETSVRKDESLQNVNANIKRILNARYGMYQTIDPVKPGEEM